MAESPADAVNSGWEGEKTSLETVDLPASGHGPPARPLRRPDTARLAGRHIKMGWELKEGGGGPLRALPRGRGKREAAPSRAPYVSSPEATYIGASEVKPACRIDAT